MAPRKVGGPAAGLPPGVEAGPLGTRFVAFLIDRSVPAVVGGLASVLATQIPGQRTLILVIAGVLILAWALLVWQMYAVRAAGPGMRLMKLQLVGYTDGRPIGWGRFFLRWLVLALLGATGIGLLFMIIFLILHPRRQGWHDLAADSVVIKERVLAPPRSVESAAPAAVEPSRAPAVESAPEDTAPVETAPVETAPVETAPVETAPGEPVPGEPVPVGNAPAENLSVGAAPLETAPVGTALAGASIAEYSSTGPMAADVSGPEEPRPGEPAVHEQEVEPSSQQPVAVADFDRDRRPLDEGWMVMLDDGREIEVSGLVLLGRNPQPRAGEEDAQLIKVVDETRTVSKSHLALGVDGNGMYVMDRGSTNGSTVTNQDGSSQPCLAGDLVAVHPGTVVSFGDHWLEVRRP